MGIPTTTFLSRQDVCHWIGITKYNLEKVVKARRLHAFPVPGHKYRKYLTKEVMRVFLKGVNYEDMGETRK
jgi:hypothetical protein